MSIKAYHPAAFRGGGRMMKGFFIACLLLLALCGCAPENNCNRAQGDTPVLHILFIGNSYTYANDLPAVFSKLACSGGFKVETGMVANGGWTLQEHGASDETLNTIRGQDWDYVVLQEQSQIPASQPSREYSMYPAVRALSGEIRRASAQPLLFVTWGHENGWPEEGISTYEEMQRKLDAGYRGIAQELNIAIVPAGDAWKAEMELPGAPVLWQDDGSHPNENGTYLAACVFYATIFQQSPQGLKYRGGVSKGDAQTLQDVAAGFVPGK
jgi:hypothetical protein